MSKPKRKETLKTPLDNFFSRVTFTFKLIDLGIEEKLSKVSFEFFDIDVKTGAQVKFLHTPAIEAWSKDKKEAEYLIEINDMLCDEKFIRDMLCRSFKAYLLNEDCKLLMVQEFSLESLLVKQKLKSYLFGGSMILKIKASDKVLSPFSALKMNPMFVELIPEKSFFENEPGLKEYSVTVGNLSVPSFVFKTYKCEPIVVKRNNDEVYEPSSTEPGVKPKRDESGQITNSKLKKKAKQNKPKLAFVVFLNDTNALELHDELKSSLFTLNVNKKDVKRLVYKAEEVPLENIKGAKKPVAKKPATVDLKELEETAHRCDSEATINARFQFKLAELVEYSSNKFIQSLNGKMLNTSSDHQFVCADLKIKLKQPFLAYLRLDQRFVTVASEIYIGVKEKDEVKKIVKKEVKNQIKELTNIKKSALLFKRATFVINENLNEITEVITSIIRDVNNTTIDEHKNRRLEREAKELQLRQEESEKRLKLPNSGKANVMPDTNRLSKLEPKLAKEQSKMGNDEIAGRELIPPYSFLSGYLLRLPGFNVFYIEAEEQKIESVINRLKLAENVRQGQINVLFNSFEHFYKPMYTNYFYGLQIADFSGSENFKTLNDAVELRPVLSRINLIKQKRFFKEVKDCDLLLTVNQFEMLQALLPREEVYTNRDIVDIEPADEQEKTEALGEQNSYPLQISEDSISKARLSTAKVEANLETNMLTTRCKIQKIIPRDLNAILTHVLNTKKVKSALQKPNLKDPAVYKRSNTVQNDSYKILCKKDKEKINPVYIYSQQKNNYLNEQMMELQKRIANDRNNHYTYSADYLSLSISPKPFIESTKPVEAHKTDFIVGYTKKIPKLDALAKEVLKIPYVEMHKSVEENSRNVQLLKNKDGQIFDRYFENRPLFNENFLNKEELKPLNFTKENSNGLNYRHTDKGFDFKKPNDKERKLNKLKGTLEGQPVKSGYKFKKFGNIEQPPVSIFTYKDTSKPFILRDNMSKNYFESYQQPPKSIVYKPIAFNN